MSQGLHAALRAGAGALLAITATASMASSQPASGLAPAGRPYLVPGLARTHAPLPTSAAIDVQDLMTRAYIVADDSMAGRETGSRGGVRATDYIASEMRRLGLKPAGENGTYFQTVPFVQRRIDSSSTLRVGSSEFRQFTHFLMVPRLGLNIALGGQPFGGSFAGTAVPSLFGGRIGAANTVDTAQARNRVIVLALPETAAGQAPAWQFWRTDNLARYAGAKAIIVDIGATLPSGNALRNVGGLFYNDPARLALPVVLATSAMVEDILGARSETLQPGAAGKPVSGRFGYLDTPTEAPTRNVVAILEGRDVKLRKQYVAITAHSDHVGVTTNGAVDHDSIRVFNAVARARGGDDPQPRNVTADQVARIRAALDSMRRERLPRLDSIFNGADDDGSGTVMVMEIAEAFARSAQRPARSLLFVWHAAEERGLYGAEYHADHPVVPRDSIVAEVNLDQMGRGGPEDAPPGGNDALVVLGLNRSSAALGKLAQDVNARAPYRFALDASFDRPGEPSSGWCRSDHYMYARYGIPSLFFVSAVWYVDLHMVSDEPQYLNYPRMARIGNYVRDVVGTIADLPTRFTYDGARPNPNAVCVQ